jgi:hypothetical protein
MVSCKKTDTTTTPPVKEEIPLKVTEQLQKSQENLVLHSQTLRIVDFKYDQQISTESEKDSIVKKLTNPDSSWYASGNLLADSTMMVSSLSNFTSDSIAQETLKNHIEKSILIGNKVVKINWRFGETLFSTLAIINDTSIIWDNVLRNLIMVDPKPITKSLTIDRQSPAYDKSYSQAWGAYWLWGTQCGEMGYTITIHCSSSSYVTSTDMDTYAWITLGTAENHSQVLNNSGSYGQIQYALGMASPLASVSFDVYIFSVTLSGIGSNIIENGTQSLYP